MHLTVSAEEVILLQKKGKNLLKPDKSSLIEFLPFQESSRNFNFISRRSIKQIIFTSTHSQRLV